MAVVRDTDGMIAQMQPQLMPGCVAFVSTPSPDPELLEKAIGTFKEAEGMSLLLPLAAVDAAGLKHEGSMRQITLQVHSALNGLGLTAAVARALTECSIPCNVVAAFHHDHVLVPEGDAEQAMRVLRGVQARAQAGLETT